VGSNDLTSRKDARNALVTALGAVTALQAIYDHDTVDFGGQSPVCTVQSLAQFPQFNGSVNTDTHQFAVEVYVNRADAGAAEDTLDDLGKSIADVIEGWHTAVFFQPSECFYAVIDGIPYRGETHFVQVDWEA